MASVVQVFLTARGPTASGESKDGADERVTYRVVYRVQTDDAECPPQVVKNYFRSTAGLPWYGRVWRFGGVNDAKSVCSKVEVRYVERSGGWYDVECVFEPIQGEDSKDSRPTEQDGGKESENPLEWRREISVTSSPTSFGVQKAIFRGFEPPGIGNNLLTDGMVTAPMNTAMVAFDPPPEFDRSYAILRIATRGLNYEEEFFAPWRDVVNSADYLFNWPKYNFRFLIKKHRGRIKHLGGTFQFDNNVQHWRIETEIWIHPISWRESLFDQGLQRRATYGDPDGNGGTISTDQLPPAGVPHVKTILDAAGMPIVTPIPLDGNGEPVPLSGPGANKRVYLNYQYYDEKDFAGCPGW